MINEQITKFVPLVLQGTQATDATASTYVDSLGWKHVTIVCRLSEMIGAATTHKWQSLRILTGDTTAISQATAVNGLVGTTHPTATDTQFVIPVNNGATTELSQVILLGHRPTARYVFVEYKPAGTTGMDVVQFDAILAEPAIAPETGAERVVHGTAKFV